MLCALYETETPFTLPLLSEPGATEELNALWPIKRFPVLVDDGRLVFESTIIIEHLDVYHPGKVRMVPTDPKAALEVRFMDRYFDQYIHRPQQTIVFDSLRQEGEHDAVGVADAQAMLDAAYAWLETYLTGREWAVGDDFSLADCCAGPGLFYADWTHAIGDFPNLHAYRNRLLARPSFAKCVEGGRPFRHFFPLGAPEGRD